MTSEGCQYLGGNLFPAPNTSELVRGLLRFRLGYQGIHGYISTIVCSFGLITNIVHVIVLSRPVLRKCPINSWMIWIAFCDIGTMVLYQIYIGHFVLRRLHSKDPGEIYSYGWMHYLNFHVWLSLTFHSVSLWLAVGMAWFRLSTLTHSPFKRVRQRPSKKSSAIRLGILLSVTLSCSIVLVSYEIQRETMHPRIKSSQIIKANSSMASQLHRRYDVSPKLLNTFDDSRVNNTSAKHHKTKKNQTPNYQGKPGNHDSSSHKQNHTSSMKTGRILERKNVSLHYDLLVSIITTTMTSLLQNSRTSSLRDFGNLTNRRENFIQFRNIVIYRLIPSSRALRNNCLLIKFNYILAGFILKMIPCLLVIGISGRIIQLLSRQGKEMRGRLQSYSGIGPLQSFRKSRRWEKRSTLILLTVVLVSVGTECPQGVLSVLASIFSDADRYLYHNLGDILDLLSLLNSSINFTLYAVMSSRYRDAFWRTLRIRSLYTRRVRVRLRRHLDTSGTDLDSSKGTGLIRPVDGISTVLNDQREEFELKRLQITRPLIERNGINIDHLPVSTV